MDRDDYTGSTMSFSSGCSLSMSEKFDPEYEAFASTARTDYDHNSDNLSVEVGRGTSKSMREFDDSRSSIMSFQGSVRSSSPAVRIDYPFSNIYAKPSIRNSSKRAVSDSLRRDAQLRQASLTNKKTFEPHSSKPSRKDHRRHRSDLQEGIPDIYDKHVIEDERSFPAMPISARTTRFGSRTVGEIQLAVQRASEEGLPRQNGLEPEGKKAATSKRSLLVNTAFAAGDTGTQQSIVLPDLLNLSELVSGIYEDPAPSVSRQNRVRTTRFVSPPDDTSDMSIVREHQQLNFVPIPQDERSLFVSLKLLQDRAANLELARSDAEKEAERLRRENTALKASRSRRDKRDRLAESHKGRPAEQPAKPVVIDDDETRLTAIDENEIAKLRKKLEAERLARKHPHMPTKDDCTVEHTNPTHSYLPKIANLEEPPIREHKRLDDPSAADSAVNRTPRTSQKPATLRKLSTRGDREPAVLHVNEDVTASSTPYSIPQPAPKRRPSVKKDGLPTVRSASLGNDMTASATGVIDHTGSKHRRRHSDHFADLTSQQKPLQSAGDIASAFILPDMAHHHMDTVAGRVERSEQHGLDSVAHHQGQNCIICKCITPCNTACDNGLDIPRPIPVSDRISESVAYQEDHTLRPGQEPDIALAIVLKALEDELAHLRMQLAAHQEAYYKLDPSVSRHKRKLLRQKIEKLLHGADMKADQIYSLYDVLEGQKKTHSGMDKQRTQDTLKSTAVDIGQHEKSEENACGSQHAQEVESETDEEDLPWEGIESTADVTGLCSRTH